MSAVLIVEDEQHLADGLRFNLEAEGYTVDTVGDGEAALALLVDKQQRYDALVLDVMLPGKDGFTVAAELRAGGHYVPVLMLTARGRPEDVLKGFEAGADDYLPKPFELTIFLARLKGLLRRNEWSVRNESGNEKADISKTNSEPMSINGRTFDFQNLELQTTLGVQKLTLMEAKLLRYLIEHAGRAVSRNEILEKVWGLAEDTDTRAIDNFIVRLRKYLEDTPDDPKIVVTVRGVGYRLEN